MNLDGVWIEFLVRGGATACVVIFIAWAAARFNPLVGGVLVGLPIVLGPAFFFITMEHEPAFVAASAAGALFSLTATQVFLATYVAVAGRLSAAGAMLTAAIAWAAAALPLALAPHPLPAGLALFVAATVGFRIAIRRFVPNEPSPGSANRWPLLILRGVAAGLLVGAVTLAAGWLGASLMGALLSFPVGFCTILLSLNLDHGAAIASRTAYAGLVGVSSLAAFCLTVATMAGMTPPWIGFALSLTASLAVTVLCGAFLRPRPALR